ncbi:MAG: hypothetical protein K1X79_05985 [Oligoflexia bacterium]|nr:hypothetical protein [Oligoflexia bacterium]
MNFNQHHREFLSSAYLLCATMAHDFRLPAVAAKKSITGVSPKVMYPIKSTHNLVRVEVNL